jgi:hypothetical protein
MPSLPHVFLSDLEFGNLVGFLERPNRGDAGSRT